MPPKAGDGAVSEERSQDLSASASGKAKGWLKRARTFQCTDDPATDLLHALAVPPERRCQEELQDILRWWLDSLADGGVELAAELRVPEDVLLQVFRQSRVAVHHAGARIVSEGEDVVKQYCFLVTGKCKLRCAQPRTKSAAVLAALQAAGGLEQEPVDPECVASGALDDDGMVPLTEVRRGESLGMYPGDKSARYEVTCLERTLLFMLNKEDYEMTLQPFHKDMHLQAVAFLQRHRICSPEATANNIERVARYFGQKRIARGSTVMRAGDPHRSLWFLLAGTCSILMDIEDASLVGDVRESEAARLKREEEEQEHSAGDLNPVDDLDPSGIDHDRIAQLRAASYGAALQQQTAVLEQKNRLISKYARGRLRQSLVGTPINPGACQELASKSSTSVRGRREHGSLVATLSSPGAMFGEEALFHDPQNYVKARCNFTVRADKDCSFYVADVSIWKQLAQHILPENIAHFSIDQLHKRAETVGHAKAASRRLDAKLRETRQIENSRQERPPLRLPPSANWTQPSPTEVEDLETYLSVVREYKRGPPDVDNPASLETLWQHPKLGPRSSNNGPGVKQMLKYVTANPATEMSAKNYCANLKQIRSRPRGRTNAVASSNPMGEKVSVGANYEGLPPEACRVGSANAWIGPGELSRVSSLPPGKGAFQHTELDVEVTLTQSSSVPILPRVPGAGPIDCKIPERDIASATTGGRKDIHCRDIAIAALGSLGVEDRPKPDSPASQLSSLFGSPGGHAGMPSTSATGDMNGEMNGHAGVKDISIASLESTTTGGVATRESRMSCQRTLSDQKAKVMQAFARAVNGKSVLVLTEKGDVKKSISRSILGSGISLCFTRTSHELWQQLQDAKSSFHALILDLTKTELAVDMILRQIRQHNRYSILPIIVLSDERELPATVRSACNFFVFHPISPTILREALLWCLDGKPLIGHAKQDSNLESPAPTAFKFIVAPGASAAAKTHPMPIATSPKRRLVLESGT